MADENNDKIVPLLKEDNIEKIVSSLECVKEHPYNRDKQRDCIMAQYPNKSEKSVFRGMIIPTLRKTGLILGYEKFIRVSGNGSLAVESKKISEKLHRRVLQALILDIDKRKFGFIDEMKNFEESKTAIPEKKFKESLASKIASPSFRQSKERVDRWLRLIKQAGLIEENQGELTLNVSRIAEANTDLKVSTEKKRHVENSLFEAYLELKKEAGVIVDIADLRERVAIKLLNSEKEILTEDQFDEILREIPLATENYIISLGRSMGAEEKLFTFKGKYYRTLTIEFKGGK